MVETPPAEEMVVAFHGGGITLRVEGPEKRPAFYINGVALPVTELIRLVPPMVVKSNVFDCCGQTFEQVHGTQPGFVTLTILIDRLELITSQGEVPAPQTYAREGLDL